MIDGAVALGANYVVLGNVNLIDLTSNVIADAIDNGINQTAPLAVAKAIVQAQAAGLSVVLKPQLATIDPAFDQYNSASWINLVNPDLKISDPAAFFASYKAMILEWGALAQKYGVIRCASAMKWWRRPSRNIPNTGSISLRTCARSMMAT